MQLPSLLRGRN